MQKSSAEESACRHGAALPGPHREGDSQAGSSIKAAPSQQTRADVPGYGRGEGRSRFWLRLALLALIMLCGPVLLWQIPALQHGLALVHRWAGQPYAALRILPIAVLWCAFGLPRQALCLALGASFGVVTGLVEASFAYGAGALLGYGWGALLRRVHSSNRGRHDMHKEQAVPWFIRAGLRAPFRMILSARLLPVGSALLVSVSSGMVGLAVGRFFLATMLGGVPQNLVFLLAGSGVELGHGIALVAAVVLALLSVILGGWVLHVFRRNERASLSQRP